jgi:RNA polymerase sigma-70 factor, ECF subfamily
MTGTRDEALDLTQEVFEKMLIALPGLDPQPSLRPWLRRVAINLCLNALSARNRRGQGKQLAQGHPDVAHARSPAWDADPVADSVAAREKLQRVTATLHTMSPVRRAVVVLKVVEGLSYEDIAQLLGLPQGTVRSHLSRARTLLRQAMTLPEGESVG